MKIDIEEAVNTARTALNLSNEQAAEYAKQLTQQAEAAKEDASNSRQKKSKKEFRAICISDNEEVRKTVENATLYIFQKDVDQEINLPEILESVRLAFNETKKGKKNPIQTNDDLLRTAKPKVYKEFKIAVKTREPVYIHGISNIIDGVVLKK